MTHVKLVIPFFIISLFPSQSSGFGCPTNVVAMRKLPMDKFLGTWYEYRYNNRVYNTPGRCTTIQFSPNEISKDVIDITITDRIKYNEVVNYAKLQQETPSDNSGFFYVTFYFPKVTPFRHKTKTQVETGVFKVLGTDGDCWAVVYSCEDVLFLRDEQTSVLVKDRGFQCVTPQKRDEIEDVLKEVGLRLQFMERTDQIGCKPVDSPK